jgi:L-iditol 2-dehydrogenase
MPKMMKAAVYHAIDDIRIEERPIPGIGPDDILLKTLACGLCGGETLTWYKSGEPKVLGHEPVGEVAEVGANVTEYKVGDRLFVNHHVGRVQSHLALRGRFTRDPFYKSMKLDPGGVCEYFRVTGQHLRMDVHRIPDHVSDAEATTIEPWSCVVGGLKHCNIQLGDTVAVVGAGFMGQGFVHLAPFFGAGKIIALDFSDWRLARAKDLGANHTINPKREDAVAALRSVNDGRLADTVIVVAPFADAWRLAESLVEIGGTLHLGAPLAPGEVWARDGFTSYMDEITVTSKYSSDHTDTYGYFRMLCSGRVNAKAAISHHFDIEESAEAFQLLVAAQESLKIIVYPHGKPNGVGC